MNVVRSVVSALTPVLGAVLIAVWLLLQALMPLVEGGAPVRAITEQALKSPTLVAAVSAEVSDEIGRALANNGIDVVAMGVDDYVEQVIANTMGSRVVQQALMRQADDVYDQLIEQLKHPKRTVDPFTLELDLTDLVEARVTDLSALGIAPGELNVPTVNAHVLDGKEAKQVRDGYAAAQWMQSWLLWIALGVMVVGVLLSRHRQWLFAKEFFTLGITMFAVGGTVAWLGPEAIAGWLPDGGYEALSNLWVEVIREEVVPTVMRSSFIVGTVAVLASFAAVGIRIAIARRH